MRVFALIAFCAFFSLQLNAQMVSNGDFESWTSGTPDSWTTIDGGITVSQETTIIHQGSSALSVNVTTGAQENTDFQKLVSVIAGHTYSVSCFVYHTEGNIKARLYVDGFLAFSNNSQTAAWQEITDTYVASATGEIVVGLRFYDQTGFDGAEIVYVDDFTLTDANGTKAEPSNHVSSLSAALSSMYSFGVSWLDNDGAVSADAYLLLVNTTGTFSDPVDGVFQADDSDLSDGSGAINVVHGTESASFTTASSSTTYYLKIWPYTNSGGDQDYKTGGSVPTSSISTPSPVLLISEVSDPQDNTSARFVELYNAGSYNIDFSKDIYYLVKQTNGGSYSNDLMAGSVLAGSTFVVSYSLASFESAYGMSSDQNSGAVVNGNGDDAYFLYYNGDQTSGILKDIYGVVNEDGSGKAWEYTDSKAVRINSVSSPAATWNASEWVILSTVAARTSPGLHPCTVWNGSANDNSWTNSSNWDNGLPGSGISVSIWQGASSFPSLSSSQSVNHVRINSGASIVGINNLNVNGTAVLQRNISGYTTASDGWHLIASPMTSMAIAGSDWISGTYDFYLYDESTATWMNQENAANSSLFTTFAPGKGYLYANATAGLKNFSGTFNSSDVSVNSLSKVNGGWHVLGNPFPSALQWAAGWTLTNVGAVAQILKADGSGYRTLVSGDIIPAGQGFWVQVSSSPGSVTIPLSACTHSSQAFSAKNSVSDIKFKLYIDSSRYAETRIRMISGATAGFDWDYDAHYLPPFGDQVPKIYTQNSNEDYALNSLPNSGTYQIPLVIEVPSTAMYLLKVEGIGTLEAGTSMQILDSYMNYTFDLQTDSVFLLEPSSVDSSDRFKILINNVITDVSEPGSEDFYLSSNNGNLDIKALRAVNNMMDIKIFSIEGKLISRENLFFGSSCTLPLNLPHSIYFIRLQVEDQLFIKKIFL